MELIEQSPAALILTMLTHEEIENVGDDEVFSATAKEKKDILEELVRRAYEPNANAERFLRLYDIVNERTVVYIKEGDDDPVEPEMPISETIESPILDRETQILNESDIGVIDASVLNSCFE